MENFQEWIQLKRALCELEVQNQLNAMEIKEEQEKLMRYTLNREGQLVEKENIPNSRTFGNPNLMRELEEIQLLQNSVEQNSRKKQVMESEL